MEDYVIIVVAFGIISWTTAFLVVRKILPKRSFGFCHRTVSILHASLCVILAALSVQDWKCPICPLVSQSSPSQIAFGVVFMVARIIIGPFITYAMLYAPTPILIKLGSAFWFYKIVRMLRYKFAKRRAKHD